MENNTYKVIEGQNRKRELLVSLAIGITAVAILVPFIAVSLLGF